MGENKLLLHFLGLALRGLDGVFDGANVPHIGRGESSAAVLIMMMARTR